MRFDINCERFCTEGKLNEGLLADPVILAGQRKAEIAENIEKLRSERWAYCTIIIEGKKPAIKVTDQIALERNIENEQQEMQELARLIKIFNQLNPLFEEIQGKYPRLRSPTLTGLQQLRSDSIDSINNFMRRVKSELQTRAGNQSKGKSLDEVLKDPQFVQFKTDHDNYIKLEEAKIKEFDNYIVTVKNILKEGV